MIRDKEKHLKAFQYLSVRKNWLEECASYYLQREEISLDEYEKLTLIWEKYSGDLSGEPFYFEVKKYLEERKEEMSARIQSEQPQIEEGIKDFEETALQSETKIPEVFDDTDTSAILQDVLTAESEETRKSAEEKAEELPKEVYDFLACHCAVKDSLTESVQFFVKKYYTNTDWMLELLSLAEGKLLESIMYEYQKADGKRAERLRKVIERFTVKCQEEQPAWKKHQEYPKEEKEPVQEILSAPSEEESVDFSSGLMEEIRNNLEAKENLQDTAPLQDTASLQDSAETAEADKSDESKDEDEIDINQMIWLEVEEEKKKQRNKKSEKDTWGLYKKN